MREVSRLPKSYLLLATGHVLPCTFHGHESTIDKWNEEHPDRELDYAFRNSVGVSLDPRTGVAHVYTNQPGFTRRQLEVLEEYAAQIPRSTQMDVSVQDREYAFASPGDFVDWKQALAA